MSGLERTEQERQSPPLPTLLLQERERRKQLAEVRRHLPEFTTAVGQFFRTHMEALPADDTIERDMSEIDQDDMADLRKSHVLVATLLDEEDPTHVVIHANRYPGKAPANTPFPDFMIGFVGDDTYLSVRTDTSGRLAEIVRKNAEHSNEGTRTPASKQDLLEWEETLAYLDGNENIRYQSKPGAR